MCSERSGLMWKKSTYSTDGPSCVEVAPNPCGGTIYVRDSKHPAGPVLAFSIREWQGLPTE